MPLKYNPTWARYEKDANDKHDPKKARIASDAFLKERDQELKTSAAARTWEKDRKAAIASQKPQYTKERLAKEKLEEQAPFLELKKGGIYKEMIKPMPGFVLIKVEDLKEREVRGIIIPVTQEEATTGHVMAVGAPLVIGERIINPQFVVGNKVMFKKFAGGLGVAGLDLNLQGENYRLMRWAANPSDSDILGVLE